MFLTYDVFWQAVLLAAALWLLIKMGGRFRDDLATLRQKHRDCLHRNDPAVLDRMLTEERRRNYQEMCVQEFRSEAVTLGLLWALTAFAGLYALGAAVQIGRMIFSAFRP